MTEALRKELETILTDFAVLDPKPAERLGCLMRLYNRIQQLRHRLRRMDQDLFLVDGLLSMFSPAEERLWIKFLPFVTTGYDLQQEFCREIEQRTAPLRIALAEAWHEAGRTDLAIRLWEDVLRYDPANTKVRDSIASFSEHQGNTPELSEFAESGDS